MIEPKKAARIASRDFRWIQDIKQQLAVIARLDRAIPVFQRRPSLNREAAAHWMPRLKRGHDSDEM
jgi:hypothetical protein